MIEDKRRIEDYQAVAAQTNIELRRLRASHEHLAASRPTSDDSAPYDREKDIQETIHLIEEKSLRQVNH